MTSRMAVTLVGLFVLAALVPIVVAPPTALALSAVCLALLPVRAALRVMTARTKAAEAARLSAQAPPADPQARALVDIRIAKLKSDSDDLIEFAVLAPDWMIRLALFGIAANLWIRVLQAL